MRRLPREARWIVALVLVIIIIAVLVSGGRNEMSQRLLPIRTSYSSAPAGLRGLYLALERLRYDPRHWRRPFAVGLPERGTLVIADPIQPLADGDWRALRRWVEAGHTLLLVGSRAVPGLGEGSPPMPTLGLEKGPPVQYVPASQPGYLTQGVKRLALQSSERIVIDPTPPAPKPARKPTVRRRRGFPLPSAPERSGANAFRDLLRPGAPVVEDGEGVVALYTPVERGVVVSLSSAWCVSNAGIAKGDNFAFVLNALGPAAAGPVYFDEYHQGYGESTLWALLPSLGRFAVLQFALAALVLLYARSRRFGRIVPLDRGPRQRSEFLSTMTAVLRKGQATRLVVRTARDTLLTRLRQQLGLPPEAEENLVLAAMRRVHVTRAEKLALALEHAAQALALPGGPSEGRALEVVRELDEAERGLRQV